MTQEEKARAYDKAIERARLSRLQLLDIGEEATEIEYIFPELKGESEDERISKEIIKYLEQTVPHNHRDEVLKSKEWTAWLEKQGEKKVSCTTLVETGNGGINALVTRELSTNNYEQKSVDKVEPKFHAGDWITNGDYIWKIIDVKPLDYILQSQGGNIVDDTISHVDEQFNLWTIQDAKDGDVLVCPLPKGYEEQIFIFKGINSRDYVENCIEYYCRVCEGEFYENKTGYMGTTSSPVYPATKEQRDTLFAKIKEAGYVWDEEMKELNKIEQKSAWSEEDEEMLRSIMATCELAEQEHDSSPARHLLEMQLNWLKSLKQRIGG